MIITGIDILSDISSRPRFEILQLLQKGPLKASEIAKKANSSIQALSRHLERLLNSGLVEKTKDAKYQLSSIAKISLAQIPFFEFLSKNNEYFVTHDFTGVPEHLISRMGELSNCRLEPDFMKSMQMAREFCINAKQFMYGATCAMPEELFDILFQKEIDFKWHHAIGTNTIVAKGFSKYPARVQCLKKFSSKNGKEKFVKKVPLVCGISENGCQLMFANKELGQIDAKGGAFFGTDKKSIQWCKELVDYYWNMPEIKDFTLKEK